MKLLHYMCAALCAGTHMAGAQSLQNQRLDAQTTAAIAPTFNVANASFGKLPNVRLVRAIETTCGGDRHTNKNVRYCVSDRVIYVAADMGARMSRAQAGYMLAHVYGHAVQIQHGIADIALATIRANRDREPQLRGMVTRQVECIAGVLHRRAYGGNAGSPATWFQIEPFQGSHWGGGALRSGPKVSIGLRARDEWFRKGRDSNDFATCASGEFSAELLVRAQKSP